jgi:hypothetical protein
VISLFREKLHNLYTWISDIRFPRVISPARYAPPVGETRVRSFANRVGPRSQWRRGWTVLCYRMVRCRSGGAERVSFLIYSVARLTQWNGLFSSPSHVRSPDSGTAGYNPRRYVRP